ncbi:hypothetical protein Tco_0359258 [Tanacetum coccineum]
MMSKSANQIPTLDGSAFQNTANKGIKQTPDDPPGFMLDEAIYEFCDKHYDQLLSLMVEKVHQEKLKGVQTRLSFEGILRKNSQTQEKSPYSKSEFFDKKKKSRKRQKPSLNTNSRSPYPSPTKSPFSRLRYEGPESSHHGDSLGSLVFTRLGEKEMNVFTRLGNKEHNVFSRLDVKDHPLRNHTGTCSHASGNQKRMECSRPNKPGVHMSTRETTLSESENSGGEHWKAKSTKQKSNTDEDDLSQAWLCKEIDPFTPRIRNFMFPKRIRLPANVKTYDGTGYLEDHLKNFQTTSKVERWAMPTWCHMFNSTLTGAVRLRFHEFSSESIDNFMEIRKAFLQTSYKKRSTSRIP